MTDSADSARGPERHADTARNVILNRTLTDLDAIINGHDPEVDTSINNLVWDRLDKMAVEIEARAERAYAALATARRLADDAIKMCEDGYPVSAYNVARQMIRALANEAET